MIFEWLKRRREERARREAADLLRRSDVALASSPRRRPAGSISGSLPGDSLDTLSPLHPLSPIYGGHAAPDTSVSHSHDGGSCASDGGSSSSSDGGSSGGGCD